MKLGEVLKEIRLSKKITQKQVGERTSISQPFLSQLEAGLKNPSPKMLKRLSDLYGVPPQLVVFKSITENDIQKKKLSLYRKLKPTIDELIDELFK